MTNLILFVQLIFFCFSLVQGTNNDTAIPQASEFDSIGEPYDTTKKTLPFATTMKKPFEKNQEETVLAMFSKYKKPTHNSTDQRKFFDAMQELWSLNDRYSMNLKLTNFVVFGPQSAGKSALIERLAKMAITVVKDGFGTTRPFVITTKYSAKKSQLIYTKFADGKYPEHPPQSVSEEELLLLVEAWNGEVIDEKTQKPTVTRHAIYIELSGPEYVARRIVDFPGYQLNGDTAEDIAYLLREELKNDDTIVIAMDKAEEEFQKSMLIQSIDKIFQTKPLKDSFFERCIFIFTQSENFYKSTKTIDKLINHLHPFVTKDSGFGMLPIFVGNSVKLDSKGVPVDRANLNVDELKLNYANADKEEAHSIREWMKELRRSSNAHEHSTFLSQLENLLGFDKIVSTIDDHLIRRDTKKLEPLRIKLHSKKIANQKQVLKEKTELEGVSKFPEKINNLVHDFMEKIRQIQFPEAGSALQTLAADPSILKNYGITLDTEEKMVLEEYKKLLDDRVINYDYEFNGASTTQWVDYIEKAATPQVHFSDHKMYAGDMYSRTQSSFAAHLFQFNKPTMEHTDILINIHGTDAEVNTDSGVLRAKRYTETHANSLRPAIHYFRHRNVFIMERIFQLGWTLLQRSAQHKVVIDTFDDHGLLKGQLFEGFMSAVNDHADRTCELVYNDLDAELSKLFPFVDGSPIMQGLLHAFKMNEVKIRESIKDFQDHSIEKMNLPHHDKFDVNGQLFLTGMETAKQALRFTGSDPISAASPLMFEELISTYIKVGVQSLKENVTSEINESNNPPADGQDKVVPSKDVFYNTINNNPDRVYQLFGFSCVLYAHFLPRFISTILGRFQTSFWGSTKTNSYQNQIFENLSSINKEEKLKTRQKNLEDDIQQLLAENTDIDNALIKLNLNVVRL